MMFAVADLNMNLAARDASKIVIASEEKESRAKCCGLRCCSCCCCSRFDVQNAFDWPANKRALDDAQAHTHSFQ